jgi:hypothetical protein
MICIVIYTILSLIITLNAAAINVLRTNLPDTDILIDVDKGFLLERVGMYTPTLNHDILYTFVPLRSSVLREQLFFIPIPYSLSLKIYFSFPFPISHSLIFFVSHSHSHFSLSNRYRYLSLKKYQ